MLRFSNKGFFLTPVHSILLKLISNFSVFKYIVLFFLPTLLSRCTFFLLPHSTILFHSIQQEDLYLAIASAIRSILQQIASSSSSHAEIPSRLTSTISQLTHLHLSLPLPPSMLLTLDDGVWLFLRSFPPPSFFLSPSSSSSSSFRCGKGKRTRNHKENDSNNNNEGDNSNGEERSLPSTFLYQALMDLRVVCNFSSY